MISGKQWTTQSRFEAELVRDYNMDANTAKIVADIAARCESARNKRRRRKCKATKNTQVY